MSVTGRLDGDAVPRETTRPGLSVLITVRGAMPTLRPAERRVAELVLAEPAQVSESSITAVARRCQTSETTVLRFCRAVGMAGYPELRIALARAAQWEENDAAVTGPVSGTITANDSLADIVAKVTHADARAVEDTAASLDLDQLDQAVTALTGAHRVDIYGAGASALVGADLRMKLYRIGLLASIWPDPHQALVSAALLGPGDVAIAISHTGATPETVGALAQAQRQGATTVAVTNFGRAPIAAHADLLLVTAARETTFRSGAQSSRIAQLAVVDCLFTGVAQRSYDRSIEALENTYTAVQGRRPPRPVGS